jgi:hypothetical protein
MTQPLLPVEIDGNIHDFVVDTGATVSLVKPFVSKSQYRKCAVQASGVSGTNLEILGLQNIEFRITNEDSKMTFVQAFVVCPLVIDSTGILGMDFLHKVGAEISLTTSLLSVNGCHFRLKTMRSEDFVSHVTGNRNDPTRGLATHEPGGVQTSILASEPLAEQWTGIVELAETVLVPPLSGRIARGRVVRRGDPTELREIEFPKEKPEPPREAVVLVDPERESTWNLLGANCSYT